MSRIYDALRKAEEEKQSQPVEQPAPRSAMEAAAQDAAETAQIHAAPTAAPAPVPEIRSTYQPVVEAAHPVAPVRTTKWNPDVSTLPALSSVSGGADEFRRIRSRLYQYRDSQPLRSILIASGLPSEGKSFVAANLAICLAQSEGK